MGDVEVRRVGAMKRPDIEALIGDGAPYQAEKVWSMYDYIRALEAARDAVLGCQHPPGEGSAHDCTRCAFDTAVARWAP